MRGSLLVRSSLSQVSDLIPEIGPREPFTTTGTNMTRRLPVLRCLVLSLTAALAACRSAGDHRVADTATGSAAATGDSAGGNVDVVPAGQSTSQATADSSHGSANHLGRIPVLEYHIINDKETLYQVTREHFRKDLQLAYDRGYRPITIAQMLDKDFSTVPAGRSPIVFVFDDASPSQFRYIQKNGVLEIDPTSAIGIWNDFASQHPDWKGKAVFCMLNGGASGHNFFGDGPGFEGQHTAWRLPKVKWLGDNGFELCDHTLWHAELNKYSDAVVQEQIARNAMGIDSAVAGYKIRTMALPKGLWPKNRPLAWQGSWTNPKTGKTTAYHFEAVLEVAGGPTRSPYDPAFDPHSISRVEAHGDELKQALDKLDKMKTRFVK